MGERTIEVGGKTIVVGASPIPRIIAQLQARAEELEPVAIEYARLRLVVDAIDAGAKLTTGAQALAAIDTPAPRRSRARRGR